MFWRSAKVLLLGVEKESSDIKRRTAALMFPASSLPETALAMEAELERKVVGISVFDDDCVSVGRVRRREIKEAKLVFLPSGAGGGELR